MSPLKNHLKNYKIIAEIKQYLITPIAIFSLVFSNFFLINIQTTIASEAVSYITPDGGSNTTVDRAQNGTPVINIAAPSSGGVSRNTFSDYNSTQENLILNNFKGNSTNGDVGVSQLGGVLQGNSNFSGNAATVILNEVTSNKITNLSGYTEIFGQKAALVIANPNGIVTSGAGFINTSRLSLVTGKPNFNTDGSIKDFDLNPNSQIFITARNVQTTQNNINVLIPLGLDASGTDFVDIISRAVQVSGQIYAGGELNIKTGNDKYNYESGLVSSRNDPNLAENKPTLAIDSTNFGGMYAGRINFIASEDGVGVKSIGDLSSNLDDLAITSKGDVEYGNIAAARNIEIKAKNIKQNDGIINAVNNIKLESENNIDIADLAIVYAGNDLDAKAAGTLDNKGAILANKITLEADILNNQNSNNQTISYGDKIISKGILSTLDTTITARQINNQSGLISTGTTLNINNSDEVNNQDGLISAVGNIDFTNSKNINNQAGFISTSGDLNFNNSQNIHNENGAIIATNLKAINIDSFINNYGQIYTSGNLEIDNLDNDNGLVEALGNIKIKNESSAYDKILNQNGVIKSLNQSGGVNLSSLTSIGNNSGSILSLGDIDIMVSDDLDLIGLIQANGHVNITANNITNQSQLQANDYILFNANGWVLNDEFAKLISNQSITINATSDITNKGLIAANTDLTLTAEGSVYNLAPTIPVGSTQAQIDNLKATYGAIYGGSGTTTITSNNGKIVNQNKISSSNNLIINANKITDGSNNFGIENTGQIAAANDLTINSNSFLTNKSGGSILSSGNIFLYVADFLENNQSEIWAQNNVVIQKNVAGDKNNKVTNLSGKISAYLGNVNIKTQHLINQNIQENLIVRTIPNESVVIGGYHNNIYSYQWNHWVMYLDNDATINGQVLNNPLYDDGYAIEFVASRGAHFNRNVYVRYQKNADDSQRGYIKAGNNINIDATTLDNIVSNIEAKNDVNINATTVNNKSYYLSELVGYDNFYIGRHDSYGIYHLGRPHSSARMATNIAGVPTVFIRNYDVIESVIIGKNNTNINATNLNNTGYTSNFGIVNNRIVEYAIGQEQYYDAGGYLTNYEDSAIGLKTIAADSANTSIGNIEKTSSLGVADSPITLPDSGNGMFKNSPDTKYLIETNLAFLDKSQFLGSNYFLTRLGFDPNVDIIQQRLGDNVYEQQMISQAISNLTKGDYLFSDVNSDYEQMQRLFDNAYDEYQAFNSNANIDDLEIGKALTDAQKAALTKDIIWLVEKEVNGKKVLVTEVYLASATIDKIKNNQLALGGNVGSIIKGKNLNITTTGDIKNQGSIFATNNLSLTSNNIFNQTLNSSIKSLNGSTLIQTNNDFVNYQGTVSAGSGIGGNGGNLSIISGGDIKNLGGTMIANNQLNLFATGDIINASLISTNDKNLLASGNEAYVSGYKGEYQGRKDGLNGLDQSIHSAVISNASLSGGEVNIIAGGDFKNQAANIISSKNTIDPLIVGDTATTSTGNTNINASSNVEISSLEVHNYSRIELGDKKNGSTTTTDISTNVLSNVNSAGNFTIDSGNNTILNAANITADEKVIINSANNLIITTATDSKLFHEEIKEENTFTFKNIDRGSFDTTVINTNITAGVANGLNNAAIEINTGNKNYVEYNKNSIANPPASLSSYLTKLNENQTLYNPITETHKHWDDVTRGLTSTSQIIIAVVMTAIMPAGAGLVAGIASAVGTVAATTAVTSGVNASMNADGNLFGSLDDIGKTVVKDTTSKQAVKSYVVAGATAGITQGLSNKLVSPLAKGASLTARTANAVSQATINTVTSSVVQSAINGDSVGDSLQNAGKNIIINAVAQIAANQIGTLAHNGKIGTTTQLTLHAGLGCAMGAASGGGSGGCASGAAAGVVGELAGMGMRDSVYGANPSMSKETAVKIAGLAGAAASLATSVATGQSDEQTGNNIFTGQNVGGNAARENALSDGIGFSSLEEESQEYQKLKDQANQLIGDGKTKLENNLADAYVNSDNKAVKAGIFTGLVGTHMFFPSSVEEIQLGLMLAPLGFGGRAAGEVGNPLARTTYTAKVQGQMQLEDYHSFPDIVDNYAGLGRQTSITGGDGLTRTRIELNGGYRNQIGTFEWIVEPNNSVNHRLFIPSK